MSNNNRISINVIIIKDRNPILNNKKKNYILNNNNRNPHRNNNIKQLFKIHLQDQLLNNNYQDLLQDKLIKETKATSAQFLKIKITT